MTYNFDPDRWYENERAFLEDCLNSGKMSDKAFGEALAKLDRRYADMLDRLDGSYQLPDNRL